MILEKNKKTKTNPSAAESDSVELWTGCLNGEGRRRALPLEAFSQKKPNPCAESAPTPSPPQPRHSLRRGQDWLSFKKKKKPQKLLSFQYLYIIHTIHRVHNFFSVASDFKLTSDGEKN